MGNEKGRNPCVTKDSGLFWTTYLNGVGSIEYLYASRFYAANQSLGNVMLPSKLPLVLREFESRRFRQFLALKRLFRSFFILPINKPTLISKSDFIHY